MTTARESSLAGAFAVSSAVPGRIRLRATGGAATRPALSRLSDALQELDAITEIQLRPASRSAILHFGPDDAAIVQDRLRELGLSDAPSRSRVSAQRDPATVVADAATTLNGAVADRLGGQDLRQLLPLGLGLMSVRQLMRGEHRLAHAPWYVLAWYASELFFRFQGQQTSSSQRQDRT